MRSETGDTPPTLSFFDPIRHLFQILSTIDSTRAGILKILIKVFDFRNIKNGNTWKNLGCRSIPNILYYASFM